MFHPLHFSHFPFLQLKMVFSTHLLSFLLPFFAVSVANGQPLVPMLCIFGDSVADVGNNNNLYTLIKSNFPPYGRDFVTHRPTDQFADGLMKSFSGFVQALYGVGVRRIGVTTLPPMGCLPAAITLFGAGSNKCVDRLNRDAVSFNTKLGGTSQSLVKAMPDLKLVVFDIYQPLLDMVTKPVDNGFFEARKACCGTGTIETSLLCNERSIGTCANATQYVFWDGFHPTEAANEILASDLLTQGLPLIG